MTNEYEEFKRLFKKKTGLDLSLYKEVQMRRRLESTMGKQGFQTFAEYFAELNGNKEALADLMDKITIHVTEFFRDTKRWGNLETNVIPSLLQSKRKLKIWSAACSTGEEPYSLAMLMANFVPLSQISILATDIDSKVIEVAKEGVYSQKAIKNVPDTMRKKFFVPDGLDWQIKEELKRVITFKTLNLLNDPYPNGCDLILCRNVIIYFTEEAKELVYDKFGRAIQENGFLFLGSTEQIYQPEKYQLRNNRDFCYQKISK